MKIYPVLFAAAAFNACADDIVLPTVDIKGAQQTSLERATSTGSNLGLTALETPASTESINRAQLVDRGDARIMDALSRAAGLSVFPHPGNGGSALAARGFTDLASVTQLYDGMKQYGSGALSFPFDTWSVERIEVLRGPASVIYGAGAIGGVVNIIPRKPSAGAIQNEIMLGIGSHDTQRYGLGSGGGISEQLSYRLDVSGNRSDNWVERGDSRDTNISAALRYDISPTLNVTLSHAQSNQHPMRYFGVPLIDGQFSPRTYDKNYNVADGTIQYRDQQTSAALHWQPADGVSISSTLYHIRSRRQWRNAENYDWLPGTSQIARSDYTEIRHNQEQTGNMTVATIEGQLFGMRNTFSGGVEFNRSRFGHTNNSPYSGSSVVDIDNPAPGTFFSTDPTYLKYQVKARQYAGFMEDRLQLDDKLSLVAGLRYDRDEVEKRDLVTPSASFEKTFNNTGYRLGAVRALNDQTSLYAQYSVAHDPLGPLLFTNTSRAAFDLAKGKQLEAGAKQVFWNGNGEWTLSAYRIVKNNLLTRDPANITRSIQVGQQSSRGVEASVVFSDGPQWRVEANATVLRAEYDDFNESSGGKLVSRAGNTPANVPERMANIFGSYSIAPHWTVLASAHYVGERNTDSANTLKMPAYTTVDLGLRWQLASRTSLTARGFNVFDKRYAQTSYYNTTQWLLGADRRYELQLRHSF
ncbi:TonB-dependent receptor [Duganella sp. sic0402]|uniref:TonB-dependent receptor n=1 Tax=Duganella sp. sic0402 TaxID=2854786 RepID=UPI001C4945BE|nr:TonB-dependent receptor [Duganella sp. sic0402]MBV7537125.1 TonB-dependent receptor [Duganella sp. sic0402]